MQLNVQLTRIVSNSKIRREYGCGWKNSPEGTSGLIELTIVAIAECQLHIAWLSSQELLRNMQVAPDTCHVFWLTAATCLLMQFHQTFPMTYHRRETETRSISIARQQKKVRLCTWGQSWCFYVHRLPMNCQRHEHCCEPGTSIASFARTAPSTAVRWPNILFHDAMVLYLESRHHSFGFLMIYVSLCFSLSLSRYM